MDFIERVAQMDEDLNEMLENVRWSRDRIDEIEKKVDALCSHLLPDSDAARA